MTTRIRLRPLTAALAIFLVGLVTAALLRAQAPLALATTRITVNGTSNVHAYTATTSTVRLVRAELTPLAGSDLWTHVLSPGGVEAFEVAIPAASLTSPREGLDKNMHKALKVEQHADIIFRLIRLEARPDGTATLSGVLTIAGVERPATIDVKTVRTPEGLAVSGQTTLLMTDFGIKPPTAMLGMLKTDPKVTVAFETTVRIPLT